MEAETQITSSTHSATVPGQQDGRCGHGGVTCRGQATGLYSGLRAEDSETQTGQMAEVRVQRGEPTDAAGVPGQSRAQDSGGGCDRGRTPAARRRPQRRLQKQGGVLCEAEHNSETQSRVHEREPGLRGLVLRSTGPVFCSS